MKDEDLEGWGAQDTPNDGYISEGEIDVQKLVAAQNRKKKKSGGFQSMGLSHSIMKGIMKKGYNIPTPIQRKTIPMILEGRDVVAMARTGSGKTAAFLIPMFEKLKVHSAKVGARALILSPTRELALQTLNFAKTLGRYTGLRAACILGGDSIESQFAAIHENPDIIIATPKRFKHVCIEMNLRLDSVEYVVFDEVDRLFEMKFADQIKYILSCLSLERQTLLFSATLPKVILEFAKLGLSDPILIRLDVDTKISENLKLGFFRVNNEDKLSLLLHFLKNIVLEFQQTVVFVPTKHHVEYIHQILEKVGISNTYVYSSLDPSARKIHMAKFRSRKAHILLVTDVAARGLDIPLLDIVINYNFPAKAKLFIHRVGRVARCGRPGTAYSFVAPDESVFLLELYMFLNKSITMAPYPLPDDQNIDWDRMYGRVPQEILDDNADYIAKLIETSYDLKTLQNSANNSLKKYIKSRPAVAPETNRRMKEELWDQNLGYHPLLITTTVKDEEKERLNLLDKLKNIRPKATIFEVREAKKGGKVTKGSFMEEKRRVDQHKIDSFHQKLQRRKLAKELKQKEEKMAEEQRQNLFKSKEDDVLGTFDEVIGKTKRKRLRDRPKKGANGVPLGISGSNAIPLGADHFIPYYSGDVHTERGYSLMSNFQKDTAEAAFDMMGDEDKSLNNRHTTKWDRKRKKFIGTDQPKKVQTESGVWVEASYKKDLYEKWKRKMLVEHQEQDEEQDNVEQDEPKKFRKNNSTFINLTDVAKNKPHPLLKGQKKEKIKAQKKGPQQLKNFDQRMKQLKEKAKRRKRMKDIQHMKKKKKHNKKRVRKY